MQTFKPRIARNGRSAAALVLLAALLGAALPAQAQIVNNAPTLANAIDDQTAPVDTPFSYTVPENTFADADTGDTLTYEAALSNSDPLPSWLTFTAATRTFTGTPGAADTGTLTVRVTATDGSDASVYDDFVITVGAAAACAAPDFGTRRQIWTGTVTVGVATILVVGTGDTPILYGFDRETVVGALDDTDFGVGANSYTIFASYVVAAGTAGAGDLEFELTSTLTAAEVAALRLHVCDTAYDFSDAGLADDSDTYIYDWELDLDWSGETTRTLYLSLPANNPAGGVPTITSTATAAVGDTLTVDTDDIADENGLPAASAYSYQWYRQDEDGTNREPIAGETSTAYTLTEDDLNKRVLVVVEFIDMLSGEEALESAPWPATGTVTGVLPVIAIAADRTTASAWSNKVTYTLTRGGSTAAELEATVVFSGPAGHDWGLTDAQHTVTFQANSATATLERRIDGGDSGIGFSDEATVSGVLTASIGTVAGYNTNDTAEVDLTVPPIGVPQFGTSFAQLSYEVTEGGGPYTLAVEARAWSADVDLPNIPLPFRVRTSPSTATPAEDYQAFNVTDSFQPSDCARDADGFAVCEKTLSQTLVIVDNAVAEGAVITIDSVLRKATEDFVVGFHDATGAPRRLQNQNYQAEIFIRDNDLGLLGVDVTSTPLQNPDSLADPDTYGAREHIEFTARFNTPVDVGGMPTFTFDIGGTDTDATYFKGSGTDTLVFSHAVRGGSDGDLDTDGIGWAANSFSGAILLAGTADPALLVHAAQSDLAGHKVNGRSTADRYSTATVTGIAVASTPLLTSSGATEPDTYGAGEDIEIAVTFSEAVTVQGDPAFRFSLAGEGQPTNVKVAEYDASRSTSTELVFVYTVQAADSDDNGLFIGRYSGSNPDTFRLDSDDRIRVAANDVDVNLNHDLQGTQSGHKVNGSANSPPALTMAIPDQVAPVDTPFSFTVPADTFADADTGDTLTYEAALSNSDPLPDWLTFTAATRTFTGTPGAADTGTLTVRVTATDGSDASVYDDFVITVGAAAACAAPDFGTRRQIWTGTVTVGVATILVVGTGDTPILYGFDRETVVGALDDTDFGVGANSYTIFASYVVAAGTAGAGDLEFELTSTLTAAEVAALRLHVCDTAYDFSDAGLADDSDTYIYDWELDLDWSGETTRTLYLSLPANNPAGGVPTITSTATAAVGDTLTVDTDDIADENGLPAASAYSYQWYRQDEDGTNREPIAGETSTAYTLTEDDLNKRVLVVVEFIDMLSGEEALESAPWPATGTVTGVLPVIAIAADRTTASAWSNKVTYTLTRGGSTAAELEATVVFSGPAGHDWGLTDAQHTVTFQANSATATLERRIDGGDSGIGFSDEATVSGVLTASIGTVAGYNTNDTAEVDLTVPPIGVPQFGTSFAQLSYEVTEGGGPYTLAVEARAWSADVDLPNIPLPFRVRTSPSTATPAEDYQAFNVTDSFQPSDCARDADGFAVCEKTLSQTLVIVDNAVAEGAVITIDSVLRKATEDFVVGFHDATGAPRRLQNQNYQAEIFIRDNDLGLLGVDVTSTPLQNPDSLADPDTYGAREHIEFTARFNTPVDVSGMPTFTFDIGGTDTDATYFKGSGTDTLVFSHAVRGGSDGDLDTDGIGWAANSFSGTVLLAGTADPALLVHAAQSDLAGHKVNGRSTADRYSTATVTGIAVASTPLLTSSGATEPDTYGAGEDIEIAVTFSEAVTVQGDPAFRFSLAGEGQPTNVKVAEYDASRSTSTELVFVYTVQAADSDDNGLFIGRYSGSNPDTFRLDSDDRIRVAANDVDVNLNHDLQGTQSGHKVNGSQSVNAAPTASDNTVTAVEDTPYPFKQADFEFADADAGDALDSVRIVTLPAAGTGELKLDGVPVTEGQAFPQTAIDIDLFTYTPPANANGDAFASFTFRVSDGTHESVSAYTMTIDVTPVEDAPALANPIANQQATVGEFFSFTIPADAFEDADGDTLDYDVRLSNTDPLPGWLTFNLATLTFEGTPGAGDAGTLTVKVSVTDGSGEASDTFDIVVAAGADAACPAPDFGTRRHIWTGTVTVGSYTVTVGQTNYGFDAVEGAGALDDTTFAIGARTHTIRTVVVVSGGSDDGALFLATSSLPGLTPAAVAALRLHVCDAAYGFSAAGTNANREAFQWSLDLDWSTETTRRLYLSLPANRAGTGAPALSSDGAAVPGDTLSADPGGITDADGLPDTFAYQWVREDADGSNPEDITGETSSTYTLTNADVGKRVRVLVGFTDLLGSAETRTSGPWPSSGAVAEDPANPVRPNSPASGRPAVSGPAGGGAPRVGDTLTVDTSAIEDANGLPPEAGFGYQWIRGDADGSNREDIPGANAPAYTLAPGDAGKVMYVRVSFTDDGGATETVTSPPTAVVAARASGDSLPDIVADGRTVTITWDEALDPDSVPAPGDFEVQRTWLDGHDREVTTVTPIRRVRVGGSTVTLELDNRLHHEDVVRVSYTPGASPVRYVAAGEAPAFGNAAAENRTPDIEPPKVSLRDQVTVNGATLRITFPEPLDPGSVPAPEGFEVNTSFNVHRHEGILVERVSVSGRTVTLTLARAVGGEESVSVSYDLTGGNPIRDLAGNPSWTGGQFGADNRTPAGAAQGKTLTADGDAVTVVFDAALDAASAPGVEDFRVKLTHTGSDGRTLRTDTVLAHIRTVAVSGSTVRLTLHNRIDHDMTVRLSYVPGDPPLRFADGTAVSAFSNLPVENLTAGPAAQQNSDGEEQPAAAQQNSDGEEQPADGQQNSDGEEQPAAGQQNSDGEEQPADAQQNSDGEEQPADGQQNSDGEEQPAAGQQSSDEDEQPAAGQQNSDGEEQPAELPPLVVSVADARVREAPGAVLEFVVSLSRPAPAGRLLLVSFKTKDGTAVTGEDYVAFGGRTYIRPGETSTTISVKVLDDAHDEGTETMTLTISGPSEGRIGVGTATGTIENSDPMPRAWLGRFGRTVAEQVPDLLAARFEEAALGDHRLTLGGRSLEVGALRAVLDDPARLYRSAPGERDVRDQGTPATPGVRETGETAGRPADGPSDYALVARYRPIHGGHDGEEGQVRHDGEESREATPLERAVYRLLVNRGRVQFDARQFLAQSSFHLSLTDLGKDAGETIETVRAAPDPAGRWSLWGRGALTRFRGVDEGVSLDGDVLTGLLGVDYAKGGWLAGTALAWHDGDGAYRAAGAAGSGDLDSTLITVNPYLRYAFTDRLSAWGTLGYGTGSLALAPSAGEVIETDLGMAMGALGLRGVVYAGAATELAVKTDALWVRTSSPATQGLQSADADTRRVRLLLSGQHRRALADDALLIPNFELGLRYDAGDAETGFGLELGGGLQYADSVRGLRIETKARALLAHEDNAYREWGISGSVSLDPGRLGRGLALRLASGWGMADSGARALWQRQSATGIAPRHDASMRGRLTAELGYGLDVPWTHGILTPYSGMEWAGARRTLTLGWRFTLGQSLSLSLDGERRENGYEPPDYSLMLNTFLPW